MIEDTVNPTNLYKDLDPEIKYDIDMCLDILLNTYNNSHDLVVMNYIINNIFTFIITAIGDDNKKMELIRFYESLE